PRSGQLSNEDRNHGGRSPALAPRHVARGDRRRRPGALPAAAPACPAEGQDRGGRRRQGRGRHGGGGRGALAGAPRGPRRDALRPRGPLPAHPGRRSRASGAGQGRAAGRPRHPRTRGRPRPRRSPALPHLGRRLGAARPAGGRDHARRQAGREPRAPRERGADRRDEHGAKAPLRHQGRPPGARGCARKSGRPDDLGRAGRRPRGHRLRADRAGPHHERRGARRAAKIRHRRAARRARPPRRPGLGDPETRRPALRPDRDRDAGDAADGARSRRRGGARSRFCARDPRQRDRGRGARCRARPCRNGAAMRRLWAAGRTALRAHLRRRDHRHGARPRARRAQRRVPAQPWPRARRPSGHRGARGRHRRHRRQRGQRWRDFCARHARARLGGGAEPGRAPRRQRRVFGLCRAGRPRRHRPDPHQRQRLPGDPGLPPQL
ncbi:MAG: D-glycerate 2-kinase, partial [uncultured Microvirga sp.]